MITTVMRRESSAQVEVRRESSARVDFKKSLGVGVPVLASRKAFVLSFLSYEE